MGVMVEIHVEQRETVEHLFNVGAHFADIGFERRTPTSRQPLWSATTRLHQPDTVQPSNKVSTERRRRRMRPGRRLVTLQRADGS